MGNCSSPISGFQMAPQAVSEAVRGGRLLTMEIEFSLRCNFKCPYCYVPDEKYFEKELSLAEIQDAIRQAKDLGAEKIIVLGGEPSIYPSLKEMVRFISGLGLTVEMFTNGSGVDESMAGFLFSHDARVVLKMNTFDEALQDRLSGKPGAYRIIRSALEALKRAGYPSDQAFLAVSTIICRQNIAELPQLWQWSKDQGIVPYFEMITPQANANQNSWLWVDPGEVYALFRRISDIDRLRYGCHWEPQPPLVGSRCFRHHFSCLVNSRGDVMPCVGVTIPLGNIRKQPLKTILQESRVLADLKNYRQTIKGPCRTCEQSDSCYGCRGAAYQMTGDYLASDPLCWKNCEKGASHP
ncbi:MAG: radical SAM/SPASM domain-containing protein [Desulfobacterales bacterium]